MALTQGTSNGDFQHTLKGAFRTNVGNPHSSLRSLDSAQYATPHGEYNNRGTVEPNNATAYFLPPPSAQPRTCYPLSCPPPFELSLYAALLLVFSLYIPYSFFFLTHIYIDTWGRAIRGGCHITPNGAVRNGGEPFTVTRLYGYCSRFVRTLELAQLATLAEQRTAISPTLEHRAQGCYHSATCGEKAPFTKS